MSALLDLAVRVSVVLLAALAASALVRHQSAARRHLVLAAGLAGALMVWPVSQVVPAWAPVTTPFAPTEAAIPIDATLAPASGEPEPAAPRDLAQVALWGWAAGSAARGLWLAVLIARVRRQTRNGTVVTGRWASELSTLVSSLGVSRHVEVRSSPHVLSPATWGWRKPVILLPDDARAWELSRVRMVLLHELAHIARHDWPVQMLGEAAAVAYWWHPLVWIVRSQVRKEGECACDDVVLRDGVGPTDYGTELLHLARRHVRSPRAAAVAMAHPSSLERRVTAMLDATRARHPLTRRAAIACGLVLCAALLPLSALRLVAQDAPSSLVVQVFDPTGAVLPGVAIALENARQGARSTTTEGSGRAVFEDVAPGEYTISATLMGFRTLNGPLAIESARDRQRSITLQVAELQETVTVRERRPPPSAAPSAAVVESPRVGGNIKVPKKLTHVSPEYPAAMRSAGLEGVVPIEALIGRDGAVVSVRVVSAHVHPEFARAASDAVKQWLFSPTLLNGEAIEVRMTVSVRFGLED